MVAEQHRISSGSDFSRVLKHGARASTRDLMVHVAVPASQWPDPTGSRRDVAGFGGPRLGLIVSKAVGNAVIRHRVARRLRAGFTQVMSELPTDALVVVRARPSTAGISSAECARQLRDALASKRIRRALEPVSL